MILETAGSIGKGVLTLAQQSDVVRRHARRLRFLWRHGRLNLTVFGPGGVGKTTFGRLLASRTGSPLVPADYAESAIVELFDLPGEEVGTVRVAPGQRARRHTEWPDLHRKLAAGQTRGVVSVVAYGYHTFEALGMRDTEYFREGMSVPEFVHAYTADRRAEELQVLRDLLPRLADAEGPLWMVTVVAKQDLWWADRRTVAAHYMAGEYDQLIDQVRRHRGEQHFRHEYRSAAFVLSNLVSGRGELLAQTASGYDQAVQLRHQAALLSTVRALARGTRS